MTKKKTSKMFVAILAFSVVMLATVILSIDSNQNFGVDAKKKQDKKEVNCGPDKTKVYNQKKDSYDCVSKVTMKGGRNCKDGTVRNSKGENICVEKCATNNQFRQIPGTDSWGCVSIKVCTGGASWDSKTNTCINPGQTYAINKKGVQLMIDTPKSGTCPTENNQHQCATAEGLVGSQKCNGGIWTVCKAN